MHKIEMNYGEGPLCEGAHDSGRGGTQAPPIEWIRMLRDLF